MADVKLPFTMIATVLSGQAPPVGPVPDLLPPKWVRIPVTVEIMLPPEVADRLQAAGSRAPSLGKGAQVTERTGPVQPATNCSSQWMV